MSSMQISPLSGQMQPQQQVGDRRLAGARFPVKVVISPALIVSDTLCRTVLSPYPNVTSSKRQAVRKRRRAGGRTVVSRSRSASAIVSRKPQNALSDSAASW